MLGILFLLSLFGGEGTCNCTRILLDALSECVCCSSPWFSIFPLLLASNTDIVRQPVTKSDLTVFWFHSCSQNQTGITESSTNQFLNYHFNM